MNEPITIEMPWPPSDNRLTRHATVGSGRKAHSIAFPSDEAKEYYLAVGRLLALKKLPRLSGKLRVDVKLYPPDRRVIDPSNRLKALLDSLKRREIGRRKKGMEPKWDPKQLAWLFANDDSQAVHGSWELCSIVHEGKAVVTLTPIAGTEVQTGMFVEDEDLF